MKRTVQSFLVMLFFLPVLAIAQKDPANVDWETLSGVFSRMELMNTWAPGSHGGTY